MSHLLTSEEQNDRLGSPAKTNRCQKETRVAVLTTMRVMLSSRVLIVNPLPGAALLTLAWSEDVPCDLME